MKVLVPESERFFCEADEEHFFGWLNGIAAVRSVTGTQAGLELLVDTPIDRASFYDLVGLLSRYNLNRACLRPLCIEHPDMWFRDQTNYWYRFVFADDDSLAPSDP